MNFIKPKTALVSLSDKTNLEALVNFLVSQNVKILSTGGTYKAILKISEEVMEVSDFTGFEEMMDGRVKTLHPKIHAGILARRDSDMEVLQERGYEPIDLVVVNLYPFQETIASECTFEEAIENIDIGGPTMIRAAAKNFKDVVVVSNPEDYGQLFDEWTNKDGISLETRKIFAQKVFKTMANYNDAIAKYMMSDSPSMMPDYKFDSSTNLRYGENPHQSASLLTFSNSNQKNIANAEIGIMINSSKNKHSLLYTSPLKYYEYLASELKIIAVDFPAHRNLPYSENILFFKEDNLTTLIDCFNNAENKKNITLNKEEISLNKRAREILKFVDR